MNFDSKWTPNRRTSRRTDGQIAGETVIVSYGGDAHLNIVSELSSSTEEILTGISRKFYIYSLQFMMPAMV